MNSVGLDNLDGMLLVLDNIHAGYANKQVLRGVSLSINRGEIVGLLGGNGSGKSTTLKIVGGLLSPTTGRVLLNGTDISSEEPHARQKMGIGYLMQGGRVFPNLSVAENFSIAAGHGANHDASAQPKLGAFFPSLAQRASIQAGLLSGGQRQMLAIELLLAQRPKLMLLDEPTGALSHDLARAILDIITDFSRRTGCGVLLVEQNAEEARRVARRTLILSSGVLSETQPVESINPPEKAIK